MGVTPLEKILPFDSADVRLLKTRLAKEKAECLELYFLDSPTPSIKTKTISNLTKWIIELSKKQ